MATAKMTLTATIDGHQQTIEHVGEIDDAQMPYFFACYREAYGQVPVDPDAPIEPGPRGRQIPMRDRTDAETFEEYAKGIASGTASAVQRYVIDQARKAAEAQVTSVNVTRVS